MTKNRKISYDNPDEALIAGLEQENAELKAHINSLREALLNILVSDNDFARIDAIANEAINSIPTQSLAEHDKKVIAEFRAKCKLVAFYESEFDEPIIHFNTPHNHKYDDDKFIFLYALPPIDNEEK